MGLTTAQREERLPSGAHLRYLHRIGWGYNMLKAGNYTESGAGGWCITQRGRELLAAHPDGLSEEVTRRIAREARAGAAEQPDDSQEPGGVVTQQAPEERIDAALKELEAAVARDLLEKIGRAPPVFFEQLVLELLHALGYGSAADDLHRVGGSGDGGIDGIISLDKLGFDKVYVQAKRWQGSVGRPEVQAFFGALAGRRAKRGVFITTSTFTREALAFGEQVSDTVVLIDGARLTSLMIEKGVAVTHYRVVRLPRVDSDYFDTE